MIQWILQSQEVRFQKSIIEKLNSIGKGIKLYIIFGTIKNFLFIYFYEFNFLNKIIEKVFY